MKSALKTSSGKQANSIHVVPKDGQYKIYDGQGRYRAGFRLREQADAYAAQLAGGSQAGQDNTRPFQQTENHQ